MSLGGILLGLAIGLCFFSSRKTKPTLFNVIYHAWINVFRGTPLLVQLFLVFYGGPYIGINLEAQQVGVLCRDVMVPLILRKYFVRVAMLSQVGKLKRRQTGVKSMANIYFHCLAANARAHYPAIDWPERHFGKRVVGAIHYYGR